MISNSRNIADVSLLAHVGLPLNLVNFHQEAEEHIIGSRWNSCSAFSEVQELKRGGRSCWLHRLGCVCNSAPIVPRRGEERNHEEARRPKWFDLQMVNESS